MSRPLNVIMDLTERCNLKCIMCYFSTTDRLKFPPFDVPSPPDGNMAVETFEKIAGDLFPRARRVALACAAEPMIHPRFKEIVAIAGRYGVPDLWFPTNLLALTEPTAHGLIDAGVTTVAASIDGITKATYEKIRVPAKFERLTACLDLLARVKKERGARRPNLRIIFTWMKSNRSELADLPAFAQQHGATEIDVRYVSRTVGVDVESELLSDEDGRALNAELAHAARDAVHRGIRLSSYPEFETAEDLPGDLLGKARRKLWRWKAGMERVEYLRYSWYQRLNGCAYPDRNVVVRPHGPVNPCIYWEGDPIGFYPADNFAGFTAGAPLARIRNGLKYGLPVGTCAACTERRTSLYRLRGAESGGQTAAATLPTFPQ